LLRDAVRDIWVARELDEERRQLVLARRQELRRIDAWLEQVECMLEAEQREVPETLIKEIAPFLRALNPKLHRSLLRNRTRDASRVLDILFDAQEHLLPTLAETA
jgi:hypothetical protein